MKQIASFLFVGFASLIPLAAFATQIGVKSADDVYNDPKYKFSVVVPKGWSEGDDEYSALKGGLIRDVYITQLTDVTSRRTKYFSMQAGTIQSIFGLGTTTIQRLTKEQIVDLYISQMNQGFISYLVTKTSVRGTGDKKVFVIEGTYKEPGPYTVIRKDYFQFSNTYVYHWTINYFTNFANYAPVLQSMVDSVMIK